MADEATDEDQGNEHVLEGSQDIMGAIDEVLSTGASMAKDATDKPAAPDQTQQQTEGEETPEQTAQRTRDEQGRFAKEQKEAADKAAAEAGKTPDATADKDKQYPAEIKSPKAREHFDALSKTKQDAVRRAESAEAKVKQHETRIQELESKSGTAAPEVKVLQEENAKLKAELDERERILSFKAVEETKAFKEGVTTPQKEALAEINSAAKLYKLDGHKLDEILAEPDKYRRRELYADMAEEMSDRAKAVLGDDLKANIEKYVAAEGKAREIFANSKGNKDLHEYEQQQTEARAALERQQAYREGNKHADDTMRKNYPELSGNEELWKGITEKAFKVDDFDRMPAKAKAFANLASWAFLDAMKGWRADKKELADLKEVMAKRNGSNLNPAGGRTAAPSKTDEDYDPDNPMGGLLGGIDEVLSGAGR